MAACFPPQLLSRQRERERRGRGKEREGEEGKEGKEEGRRERERWGGRERETGRGERLSLSLKFLEAGKSQRPWRIRDWVPGHAYPPTPAGHRGQGQETHLPLHPPLWCVDLIFTEKQPQTPVSGCL